MNVRALAKIALAAGAAVGGAAVANAAISASTPPLEPWFDGDRHSYFWRGFKIAYTSRGQGRPVLLVHGIHAAASSYEWRHNFEALSEHYRVYAVDLLGFGLSDRPPVRYTSETYVQLLIDFLRDVFIEPPAVIASSLSAAFAVSAAYRAPSLIAGLALVCPTGLRRLNSTQLLPNTATQVLLEAPVLGQSLYNMLVSEASIKFYLRNQVFFDEKAADKAIVSQMYATSHQHGAKFAPTAFVSGALNLDISEVFPRLDLPTLVIWGEKARVTPMTDSADFVEENARVRLAIADDSGLLPHDEQAGWFNGRILDFLG